MYDFNYKNGALETGGRKAWRCEYDIGGNLLKEIEYWEHDTLQYLLINTYNTKGKLVGTHSDQYDIHGKMQYRWVTEYDSSGNPLATVEYDTVSVKERIKYTYGEKQKLIREETIEQDTITTYTTYSYNEEGKLKEEIVNVFDTIQNKELIYGEQLKIIYQYDSNGNITDEIEFRPSYKLSKKTSFKYDPNNNLVATTVYDSDGKILTKQIKVYDGNNNCVEWSEYYRGETYSMGSRFKYDNRGNCIEAIQYHEENQPDRVSKFQYEFYK